MVARINQAAVKLVTLAAQEQHHRALAADLERHDNWLAAAHHEDQAERCQVARQDVEGRQ